MSLWLAGEHRGQKIRFSVDDGTHTVGRSAGNDLALPSQTVSRNHAELRFANGDLTIVDLESLNGTRVNGNAVESTAVARIGDVIEFGSVVLRLLDTEESQAPLLSADDEVSESLHIHREDSEASTGGFTGQEPGLLRLLIEAGQLLVVSGDPEENFDRLLELVERTIPANRIIILMTADDGEPIQRAARVHGDRAISPLMLSRTMVRMVMDEGASFLTGDAQSDERFRHQQSVVAQDLHSAMAVPLVHDEETLGLLYVDTNDPLTTYSGHDLRVLTLLGQMLGAKVANARLLAVAAEQERLAEELKTAAGIQRRMLPQTLPEVPGYELIGKQETSEAVGGDLYDAGMMPDGRCQIVLGDVSGKGIGAALLMSDVLATIRAFRGVALPPDELAEHLNKHLLQTTEPEHYVTLFVAHLDHESHRLEFVNGGHPPAILIRPDGEMEQLESSGPPPGLIDLPGIDYEGRSLDFPPGSTLVVYSDGVSEAQRGEEFFGDDRLFRILKESASLDAQACAKKILEAVDSYLGDEPAGDDTTLVVVRRTN